MSTTIQTNVSGGKKLPRRKTAERYGVCPRTVGRWERDSSLGFPKATRINDRLYDDEDALTAWDRAQAAQCRM
jgi:hypothetical protein